MFRIQKLLMAEFEDIYEPVVVENPFTQVNESGQGIRQYHIALTRSNIIFGCDDFDDDMTYDIFYRNVDPEIETLQLVSLLPLQFVRLHFFRKQNRDIMRVTVCNEEDNPMFFEFGGHIYRKLFWNTWRERVSTIRLLHPDLFHISGSSPFSSSDIIAEDEIHQAQVHTQTKYLTDSFSCVTDSL